MKLSYSRLKTGGYLLAFFLLFGILVTVASSTAQAQYRRYDRRNDNYGEWSRRNAVQVARQQGYSYGMNVGAADAQRGQSFNPQRSRYYRSGSAGYSSSYGNRGVYRQVFRDAFIQGYRDGFQRYAYRRDRNRRW
jgi:hypothetical protein